MRISATRAPGFTLVEIMAVILLIGLALGTVLSVGLTREEQTPQAQLRMFANEFRLQTGEALLETQTLGLFFFRPEDEEAILAWCWLQWGDDGWQAQPTGQDMTPGAFHAAAAELSVEGMPLEPAIMKRDAIMQMIAQLGVEPQVLVYPTREVTPFRLMLRQPQQAGNQLNVDLMGRVVVDAQIPTATAD